jgi:hypothetical protein
MENGPQSYDEWHSWGLSRFNQDPELARRAALAALEIQELGLGSRLAQKAAVEAASHPLTTEPRKPALRVNPFLRLMAMYQVAMGVYLFLWVGLVAGRPICVNIDAPCGPGGGEVLLPASVAVLDVALVALNVAAGAALVRRKRWALLPFALLQLIDAASIGAVPRNQVALLVTLVFILPAGWIAGIWAVIAQILSDRGAERLANSS